jgi:integrase
MGMVINPTGPPRSIPDFDLGVGILGFKGVGVAAHLVPRRGRRLTERADRHDDPQPHASTLLTKGIDIKTVSKRIGHSDPVITLKTYAHAMKGTDEAAAEVMQLALGGTATD